MANPTHVNLLRQGEMVWNQWREENRDVIPDLSRAELQGAQLENVNLSNADLREARLAWADLRRSNLKSADLRGIKINDARAPYADFSDSKLQNSYLWGSDFRESVFCRADLSGANLMCAQLVGADFCDANLTGCKVYGTSAWEVKLEGTKQHGLVITSPNAAQASAVVVDNLEVAQFIYLLLNNQKLREVIDTITSKVVLILGRFTPERKIVLDGIRDALRKRNYLPILFDFEKPTNRDVTETVSTLAHMARFVIADITDAKSIPQELMAIVPSLPSVPVQPLLLASQKEYGMFEHFKRYPWVLAPYLYENQDILLASLEPCVIGPAEKINEQAARLLH